MTKAQAIKKITRLLKSIRKVWFEYLDSLDEKGNEKAKTSGYLSLTIFRTNCWFNSYNQVEEMKKENQVYTVIYPKGNGDGDEVENYS